MYPDEPIFGNMAQKKLKRVTLSQMKFGRTGSIRNLVFYTFALFTLDNTASILTRRNGFRRQEQSVYYLPIFIVDSGSPSLSSTNTLTIRVCDCDADGVAQTCNAEAYVLPAGLSTGALIAILACVLTLLGRYHLRCFFCKSGHNCQWSELFIHSEDTCRYSNPWCLAHTGMTIGHTSQWYV